MIEAGRYKAKGVLGALGETSKGAPQVAVLVEITEGEHAGTQLTWHGYFTQLTEEKTLEQLRVLGWSTDDLDDLKGIDANEVSIVVEHETDDKGETRAKVRWINRPGGLAMKQVMDATAAKRFAASMKAKAIASRRAGGAAPRNGGGHSRPAPQERSPFDDEPPPF